MHIDVVASDVGQHVADDAECCRHGLPCARRNGLCKQQRCERRQTKSTRQHQAELPIAALARWMILVMTIEAVNRQPAASMMASPDGRFA
jgi:hypothetical protein